MAVVQDFFESPAPPSPQDVGAHPLTDHAAQEWERTYAMFEHLSLIAAHIVPVIPALVMWLMKRERSPFVDDHGREALNFQISLVIYFLIGLATTALCGVGVAVMVATYGLGVVGMILGAVAANKGRYFRYPACIRLIH
jgi:uncharacterized protein